MAYRRTGGGLRVEIFSFSKWVTVTHHLTSSFWNFINIMYKVNYCLSFYICQNNTVLLRNVMYFSDIKQYWPCRWMFLDKQLNIYILSICTKNLYCSNELCVVRRCLFIFNMFKNSYMPNILTCIYGIKWKYIPGSVSDSNRLVLFYIEWPSGTHFLR